MRFPLSAAVVLLAASLPSQSHDLIGLTRTIPLVRQEDPFNCVNTTRCAAPVSPVIPPFAGGTAYDAANGGVWISDGKQLLRVDGNCNIQCPPSTPPIGTNLVVTGLAVSETTGTLWLTDSGNIISELTTACPPTGIRRCATGIPTSPTASLTGIAVDDKNRLVFTAHADFATGASLVMVSSMATPCQILSRTQVGPCSTGAAFGPVTGLAVDWCKQILFLTDGVTTQGWQYTWVPATPSVTFAPVLCCTVSPANDPYVGLCIRPAPPNPFGQPCANGPCPACPMVHGAVTDPLVGNPSFVVDLQQAPQNALAWLIVGAGPCAPGPVIPPLCGPVHIGGGAAVLALGPNLTGGGAACSGAAKWNLKIPLAPTLCGTTWSSQAVVLCPSRVGFGTSLSNCLTWTLLGS